jgi:hypothetical protein
MVCKLWRRKMKNKILSLMIIGIFLFSLAFVSAECTNYGTFKQNTAVSLIQTCTTCVDINASITFPDSTSTGLIEFQEIDGIYNYTFNDTKQLGTYNVIGKDAWCYSFDITPSGDSGSANTVFFLFIILFIYALNLFGFFGKNEILTILGGMALIFLGVYMINNGIIIFRDNITNYIAYITIAWGAMSSIWAGLALMDVL